MYQLILKFFVSFTAGLLINLYAQANPLFSYQWNKRLLILATPESSQETFRKQLRIIDHNREGILDRDIHIIRIIGDELSGTAKEYNTVKWGRILRSLHQLNTEKFTIVLIGKDGGEKARSNRPITFCNLFNLIDLMPMRREEISERKRKVNCKTPKPY
ncbi:MAG: hypothetical protein CMM83_06945 [Rhodospirillales bacterium]|nr:hypothetical protein [Rhodospirillales bacterium]